MSEMRDSRGRERGIRMLLACLGWYVGCLLGGVYANRHFEVGMLAGPFGMFVGALVTPVANVLDALSVICGALYVLVLRLPRWTVGVLVIVGAAVSVVTLRMWRAG